MPDLDPTLDLLVRLVPDAAAVYLFGSHAAGTATPGSDLDLAVVATRPLGTVERFDVQERLAATLGRDVDLVDLHSASTVMQARVVSTGRCVARIRETVEADAGLATLDAQDVVVLNLQHAVRTERPGLPQTSCDAFAMLADAGALAADLAAALMHVVGLAAPTYRFRNAAVHEYRALNLDVVRAVAVGGLGNVEAFARWMTARA